MNKRIFYFDKPSKWDLITLFIYLGLTVFIFFSDISAKKDLVFAYSFGTHLFIYFFNYKSLRKLNIWLIWFLISLVHLYLYRAFVNAPELQMFRGPAAHGLQFTWLLLILFQLLRFTSAKIQNQELVAPSRSRTDIWDNRRINFVDSILFVIYMVVMLWLDTM